MKKIMVGAMALAVCCVCGDECVFGSEGQQLQLSDEQIVEVRRVVYGVLCHMFACCDAKPVVEGVRAYVVKNEKTMAPPSDAEGVYRVFVDYALRGPDAFVDVLTSVGADALGYGIANIIFLLARLDEEMGGPNGDSGFYRAACSNEFILDDDFIILDDRRKPLTTLVGVGKLE
jgi:hypothetical protein